MVRSTPSGDPQAGSEVTLSTDSTNRRRFLAKSSHFRSASHWATFLENPRKTQWTHGKMAAGSPSLALQREHLFQYWYSQGRCGRLRRDSLALAHENLPVQIEVAGKLDALQRTLRPVQIALQVAG